QHRYIPLAPWTREAVQVQFAKKHADSDFVLHRPDGSPWGDIGDSIEELVVRAGLQKKEAPERLTPHSLRHTFASWLAIAGVSFQRIQELQHHHNGTVFAPGAEWLQPILFRAGCVCCERVCTKVCNKPLSGEQTRNRASY